MFVTKGGRVAGSINRAELAELYRGTDDEELRAYYRELLGDSDEGKALDDEAPNTEAPEADVEEKAATIDDLRAQAEARGIKVDGRWGEDRLREAIADYEIEHGGES